MEQSAGAGVVSTKGWLCGFNYLPSTAVNWTDIWQKETFDVDTIDRELGWAADAGYNTLRINLPFIVWENDRDGLMARIDRFLTIADHHGFSTMLTLMDDCGFSGDEPYLGPQKPPVPGKHNSQAAASPGREKVCDRDCWPTLSAISATLSASSVTISACCCGIFTTSRATAAFSPPVRKRCCTTKSWKPARTS
jgi:hypothetical protein